MVRPSKIAMLTLLLSLGLAAPAGAKPGSVTTRDGKTWEGDVTEDKQQNRVSVIVDGKKYSFSRDNVDRVEYDPNAPATPPRPPQPQPNPNQPQQPAAQQPRGPGMSAEEEFQKRRAALPRNDAPSRVALARWAFERQEYDLARDAVDEALQIDPRNQQAQEMSKTIDAQRRLTRKAADNRQPPPGGPPAAEPVPAGNAAAPRPAPAAGAGLVRPLDADEVNRVRLLEWHGDRNVRVRLQNDVKRRYLARARDITPAKFNQMDAVDQAWEIRKNGSEELWNDVRIVNDPPALHEYRTVVQRALLTGCATAACHGGGAGSERFALHPRADKEPEAYANFITLHNFQSKPEGGREASMIDRTRPEDSLLIQYGLPPDAADTPHPDVEGYRPLFRNRTDARYKQVVGWIANSLSPLPEDYGVPFDDAKAGRNERPALDGQDNPDAAPPGDGAPPRGPAPGATPPRAQPQGRPPAR